MATLNVSTTTDFRNAFLFNITEIVLDNAGVRAIFDAAQFGPQISNAVTMTALDPGQEIVVTMASAGAFSAAKWNVGNWRADALPFRFEGSAGNDTITGSSINDIIRGGNGADTLHGGGGDDLFRIDFDDVGAGEVIDGGIQTTASGDTLALDGGGVFDLRIASLTGLERLQFNGRSTVTLTAAQAAGFTTFDNQSRLVQDVFVTGSSVDLSGLAFTNWNSAVAHITVTGTSAISNSLIGSSQADTIQVSTGLTTMRGGGGADTLIGGGRRDTFQYFAPSEIVAGESIDGNGDQDVLAIMVPSTGYDFRQVAISEVEALQFAGAGTQQVTLNDSQVKGGAATGAIASVIGNASLNALVVLGRAVDLSTVAFSNWQAGVDVVQIGGTAGNDILIGSAQDDLLDGFEGADVLRGGGGNDVLRYRQSSDMSGGATRDTLDGGSGTDVIEVFAGFYDFAHLGLTSIEALHLSRADATVRINAAQGGAGLIQSVTGSVGRNTLIVDALNTSRLIDIGDYTFSDWTTGEDSIVMNGSDFADVLIGSDLNEEINGRRGADNMFGRGGDDVFIFANGNGPAGEVIDGGQGTDTIRLANGAWGIFREVDISGVEILEFNTIFTSRADFEGSQLGAGAIATVRGSLLVDQMNVFGSAIDLSGVTFTGWDSATDDLFIFGTAGADRLIGSSEDDFFVSSEGADVLDGGGGANTLGLNSSTAVVINLGNGQVSGGNLEGDVIANFSHVSGTFQGDVLIGNGAANRLFGGGGADTIFGGANDDFIAGDDGADILDGEGGANTLSYALSLAGVTINLGNGQSSGGDADGDTIRNFRHVNGSRNGDALLGDGLANTLDGAGGADQLFGGLNDDTFVFRRGEANGDTVFDFTGNGAAAGDQLHLIGYGAGAIFVQVDATHWEIRSSFATETLTLANGAGVHASDVLFL